LNLAQVATGLRNTKPVLRPQKVSFVEYGDDLPKIVDVAAGGSFGLALDEQRRAYAWGLWSGGRLGLGDTPTLERDARVDATRQRRAMFQLSPRAILRARPAPATRAPDYHRTGGEARDEKKPKNDDDDDDAAAAAADGDELEAALVDAPRWRSVACGEAHVLAVAEDGALYAWGSNAQGQLGLGPSHFFDFRDERRPTPVVPFCGGDLRVAVAACGATHSAVVDERGATWTWGGGGSRGAALGHGERPPENAGLESTTDWMTKRVLEKRRPGGAVDKTAKTLRDARFAWPRRVVALDGVAVAAIACGERHSAFSTAAGDLLLCGDGFAFLGASATEEASAKVGSLAHAAAKAQRAARLKDTANERRTTKADAPPSPEDEAIMRTAVAAAVVDVPRRPSAVWLPGLDGSRVSRVACGGQHTVALVDGPMAAETVGRRLLRAARRATRELNGDDRAWAGSGDDGDGSDDDDDGGAALVDCMLVPGGGAPLYAHLAVLNARSPLMAELILLEQREDGDDGDLLQLLVPDLSPRVCALFLEFLYCDDVFAGRDPPPPSLLAELGAAGRRYGTPRLRDVCAAALGAPDDAADDDDGDDDELRAVHVAPSTLRADLAGLVGDGAFGDVAVAPEDAPESPVYAHRAVLAARSDFFRAMFASGMRETRERRRGDLWGDGAARAPRVEVAVPDGAATVGAGNE